MRRLAAAAIAGLAVACGGSASAPTPNLASLSISAPDGLLFLGESYTFTTTLRRSDGTTVAGGGTWGTDAPTVASVQTVTGLVQVVGLGEATIFVDHQGQRATKRIRSTVRYRGTFSASWRVASCTQTAAWAAINSCADYAAGSTYRLTGVFTQADAVVIAVMRVGSLLSEPVTVVVPGSGELRFQTEHRRVDDDLIAAVAWMLRPSGLTMVDGTATVRWRVPRVSGYMEVRGTLLPATISRTLDVWAESLLASPESTLRLPGARSGPR